MGDRYAIPDSEFAKRRKQKAQERKIEAHRNKYKDRIDALAKGKPTELPPPPEKPGPPPDKAVVDHLKEHPDIAELFEKRRKEIKEEFDHADATNVSITRSGHAIIPDCKGLKIAASGKALLVASRNLSKPDWFPLSGIHDDSDVYQPDTDGDLILEPWLARKRGWV